MNRAGVIVLSFSSVLVGSLVFSGVGAATPTWNLEEGIRFAGAVPDAFPLGDGRLRLYYAEQGIRAAVSEDGLSFVPESAERLLEGFGADPTVVQLADGSYRLYYKVLGVQGPGGPDQQQHRIHTASSMDGLNFTDEGLAIRQRSDGSWVSVPDAAVLPDGRVRVFYVSEESVKSSTSTDATGRQFVEDPGVRFPSVVDPDVMRVGDVWVMTFSTPATTRANAEHPQHLGYAVSEDAYSFQWVEDIYREDRMDLLDPTLALLPDGRGRVYFWREPESQGDQAVIGIVSDGPFTPMLSDGKATSPSPPPRNDDLIGDGDPPRPPDRTPGLEWSALAVGALVVALRRRP